MLMNNMMEENERSQNKRNYTPNNFKVPRRKTSMIKHKRNLGVDLSEYQTPKKLVTNLDVIKQSYQEATKTEIKIESVQAQKKQKYSIIKKLGEGSNTKVYKALNTEKNVVVAIKKFNMSVMKDEESRSYLEVKIFNKNLIFQSEINSLFKLGTSKYVNNLVEVLESKHHLLLVLSYEGELNLRDFLKKHPNLSVKYYIFVSKNSQKTNEEFFIKLLSP